MSKYIEEVNQEERRKMFLSGVQRVFSRLDDGERFGSTEELAKALWGDSNIQYAIAMAKNTALQKQIEMIEGEIEHQKEQLQKETGAFKYDFVYDGVLSILNQYK